MKTAICIASGPSLTQKDVDYCRGKGKIYVVNEVGLYAAPWADVLYAADAEWWVGNEGAPDFKGEKWTCNPRAAELYDLNYVKARTEWFWSTTPGVVATGGNSGFQAVNLAALDGAERIILLGYDMGHNADEPKHFFDNEHEAVRVAPSNYTQWIQRFAKAAKYIDIPVLNATKRTNLTCFEKVDLRDVL